MILAMMLFGLNLDPLFDAIADVESTSGKRSANVYQITDIYLRDVNRIMLLSRYRFFPSFRLCDRFSPMKSQDMMLVYWRFYGDIYKATTGKTPTIEVLARIHNGGPYGYRLRSTAAYWRRVRSFLNKQGAKY